MIGINGGGDLDNLRPIVLLGLLSSIGFLFVRCIDIIWLIKPSVPLQTVMQRGHLWKLIIICSGAGSSFDWILSSSGIFDEELISNLVCFRWVIMCFLRVEYSLNGRLHSKHWNSFSPKINIDRIQYGKFRLYIYFIDQKKSVNLCESWHVASKNKILIR